MVDDFLLLPCMSALEMLSGGLQTRCEVRCFGFCCICAVEVRRELPAAVCSKLAGACPRSLDCCAPIGRGALRQGRSRNAIGGPHARTCPRAAAGL